MGRRSVSSEWRRSNCSSLDKVCDTYHMIFSGISKAKYLWKFWKDFEKGVPGICWNTWSFDCQGVSEGIADMQHCWPYLACCMSILLPRAAIGPTGIVVGHCGWPSVHLAGQPSVRLSVPNDIPSWRILVISLKFIGMIHSTMDQMAIEMAMLSQLLCVPRNFEIFHDRLFDQVWGTTLPL